MLTSGPKISDLIKNRFFQLNLAWNKKKIEPKYFSGDFKSFWDSLTTGFVMHLNQHFRSQ